jgi:hypothetical protein
MKSTALVLAAAAVLLVSTLADAQAPARIRGTITTVNGPVMTVQADGKTVEAHVNDATRIVYAQAISLGDIKPGDFLAVTSMKRADGTLTAYDVRRFPKPSNPGHRPFEGRDDQTMTNASLSATAQSTSGRELVLTYEGGSQKVSVPAGAAISALTPGQRSQLVPGSYVSFTAAPDQAGKLTAGSIEVRKSAPKPQ